MKLCDYCGRENSDDAIHCRECGTQEFTNPENDAANPAPETETPQEPEPEPELTDPNAPKFCEWCGRENLPEAAYCNECGTALKPPAARKPKPPETPFESSPPEPIRREFRELTEAEKKLDLVTLLTCRTLVEADVIVGHLESIGIVAFIPDEFLAQAMSWNLNAFGYVRVQVSPDDYERAKAFLLEGSADAAPGDLAEPPGSSGGEQPPAG